MKLGAQVGLVDLMLPRPDASCIMIAIYWSLCGEMDRPFDRMDYIGGEGGGWQGGFVMEGDHASWWNPEGRTMERAQGKAAGDPSGVERSDYT